MGKVRGWDSYLEREWELEKWERGRKGEWRGTFAEKWVLRWPAMSHVSGLAWISKTKSRGLFERGGGIVVLRMFHWRVCWIVSSAGMTSPRVARYVSVLEGVGVSRRRS